MTAVGTEFVATFVSFATLWAERAPVASGGYGYLGASGSRRLWHRSGTTAVGNCRLNLVGNGRFLGRWMCRPAPSGDSHFDLVQLRTVGGRGHRIQLAENFGRFRSQLRAEALVFFRWHGARLMVEVQAADLFHERFFLGQ